MTPRFVAIASMSAFVAGCNTMQGVGEDISAGGQKVEDVKDRSAGDSNAGTTSTPGPSHQRVER